jgi:hypothetical protein
MSEIMQKIVFLLMILISTFSFAQKDSLVIKANQKETSFLKKSIVPLSLIGTGLIINYSNGSIGKENLQENIQNSFPDFDSKADNYLLFVPALTMYAADLLKVESKNDAFTQTKYLAIAGLANSIITLSMKRIANEERPNGDDYSFPSGHTSNAFVMATVLHHEFKDTNTLLAYSGYLFATTTGVMRVLNNYHWVSDVLVGAGIGILVTDLVYRFEPLKNWNPFSNEKISTIISPTFSDNKVGLYANIRF